MTIRKIIGQVHLWLGLATGIVVVIVGITGCLYVFREEISLLTGDSAPRIDHHTSRPYMPPSMLFNYAERYLGSGKRPSAISYETGKACWIPYGDENYNYTLFLDPFTGALVKKEVHKKKENRFNFFGWALSGHRNLWLPWDYGHWIVDFSILFFVVLLITGLVLWWPKNLKKANRDKSFKIKWGASFKRVNYDLHNVPGFYVMLLALIISLTGLVYSFQWVSGAIYWVASGGKKNPGWIEVSSDTCFTGKPVLAGEDKIWETLWNKWALKGSIYMSLPEKKSDTYFVNLNANPGTLYKQEIYYYDRNTLKELNGGGVYSRTRYATASFADKGDRMNYDLHTGQVLGLPTKILAFGASLICATLPVTGFLIWWGRRKKKTIKRR